jgi:hypothetical protein
LDTLYGVETQASIHDKASDTASCGDVALMPQLTRVQCDRAASIWTGLNATCELCTLAHLESKCSDGEVWRLHNTYLLASVSQRHRHPCPARAECSGKVADPATLERPMCHVRALQVGMKRLGVSSGILPMEARTLDKLSKLPHASFPATPPPHFLKSISPSAILPEALSLASFTVLQDRSAA